MQTIRKYGEVKNGQVVIKMPKKFKSKKVEVIIYPVDESKDKKSQDLSEILLNGPTLTNKELEEIENISKWMSEWKSPEY